MSLKLGLDTVYDGMIKDISEKHGNDPAFVKSIIRQESRFNPKAHNTNGEDSRGLGQINAPTARALGCTDLDLLFVEAYNIEYINRAIDDLKTRYTELPDIAAAYNAGRVKQNSAGEYINAPYVRNVMARYYLYKAFPV